MSRYTNYVGDTYFTIKDENKFKEFRKKYDWGETLLHLTPPKNIGDKWTLRFGYKDGTSDINHFGPEEQLDWFEELSELIFEPIDLICLDEEFPIIGETGYAYRLQCKDGKCSVNDLILKEEKEQ